MDVAAQIYHFLDERFSLSNKGILLTSDTLLLDEGIVDSIGMLELVLFVEDAFSIEVPDEDLVPDNFDTINKLAIYVNKRRL